MLETNPHPCNILICIHKTHSIYTRKTPLYPGAGGSAAKILRLVKASKIPNCVWIPVNS